MSHSKGSLDGLRKLVYEVDEASVKGTSPSTTGWRSRAPVAFSCLRNVAERLNSMVYGRYQELVSIVFMGFINQDLHKIGGTILYISIS